MQFKVPQDVLRPDRIVGFLTLRQLIIVALGGGVAYSLYIILSKQYFIEVWLPPVFLVAAVTLSFAFIKYHDLLFEKFILVFIEYKFRPRSRTWQKMRGDALISVFDAPIRGKKLSGHAPVTQISEADRQKKLTEMSKAVDTHAQKIIK